MSKQFGIANCLYWEEILVAKGQRLLHSLLMTALHCLQYKGHSIVALHCLSLLHICCLMTPRAYVAYIGHSIVTLHNTYSIDCSPHKESDNACFHSAELCHISMRIVNFFLLAIFFPQCSHTGCIVKSSKHPFERFFLQQQWHKLRNTVLHQPESLYSRSWQHCFLTDSFLCLQVTISWSVICEMLFLISSLKNVS